MEREADPTGKAHVTRYQTISLFASFEEQEKLSGRATNPELGKNEKRHD